MRNSILFGVVAGLQLLITPVVLSQPQTDTAHQPHILYGRIEQLSSQSGAQLPTLNKQSAKVDQSALSAGVSVTTTKPQAQFPDAFLGYWQGQLKVHYSQFTSLAYDVDREETTKQVELLAPGKTGSVTFAFVRSGGRLCLEPSRIIFSAPMSQSRHADELRQLSNTNPALGQQIEGFLENAPYYYGLEMGNVAQGVGITGNALHNQVVKNDIKQLGAGVVEQDLVSYNQERNAQNGRMQSGYSEMVLRFYQQGGQQLYVQVASVNYLSDGRFKDKILLYGTVHRVSSSAQQHPVTQPEIPSAFQDFIKQMTNGNSGIQNPYR